jgi:hypothetical protein
MGSLEFKSEQRTKQEHDHNGLRATKKNMGVKISSLPPAHSESAACATMSTKHQQKRG